VYLWALLWLLQHRKQVGAVIDSQNGIPFFTPLAIRRHTPVLLMIHHVHQEQFSLYFGRVMAAVGRWLEAPASRWVYRRRALLVISAQTRQQVRQRLRLQGEITVAPPGINQSAVGYQPAERSVHPSIVCVGRLVPHKQLHLLVQLMPTLLLDFPRLQLHIVGDVPSRPALQQLIAQLELGRSTVLHGMVSEQERDRLVVGAWLEVNVSAAEGWGLSVIEANALGVPVLSLDQAGMRDSIRDGETGWLVPGISNLAVAITAALCELQNPAAAQMWAARARVWAARFTWEEMGRRAAHALQAERGRLSHKRSERRRPSDVATVAYLPATVVPQATLMRFRTSDCIQRDGDGTVVLLRGTDTFFARSALERAGLPSMLTANPEVVYRVARPVDFVSPSMPSPVSARDGDR